MVERRYWRLGCALPWLAALLFICAPARADEKLRVGYAGSAPFVVERDAEPQGLSVRVWGEIAKKAGVRYELVPTSGVSALIDGVERGDLDVAVGPISITAARSRRVEFTQPYLRLVVPKPIADGHRR